MSGTNDPRYWCTASFYGTTYQHWIQWPAPPVHQPNQPPTKKRKPMRTKIFGLLAGVLLVLGVSVALPGSANAAPPAPETPENIATPERAAVPERVIHNGSPEALWYCAAHRPNGYHVVHAWPYALWDGGVGYWCIAGFYGRDYQYWVHVEPPGSSNSYRPWPFQLCYNAPGWVSYCQGPNGTHGPR